MDKRPIFEYVIIAILGLGLNYLNQMVTWNFDSIYHAKISFVTYSFIYAILILYCIPRVAAFLKRVKINPEVVKSDKINHFFKYFKSIVSLITLLFLLTIYLFSFFQFKNYLFFKNGIISYQNIRVNSFPKQIDPSIKWVVVNNLFSEFNDDETNNFANNFHNSFQEIIETNGLQIAMHKNITEDEIIDSLIEESSVLITIYGTYYQGDAEIYLNKYSKINKYGHIAPLANIFGDTFEKTVDSLARMKESENILKKNDIIKYGENDNPTFARYNLKIGVPNEIRYIVYSAISEIIALRAGNIVANNSEKEEFTDIVDQALLMLNIAENNVPYEVNYLSTKPKIRSGLNINYLYSTRLNLLVLKTYDLFNNINVSEVVPESELLKIENILGEAKEYYNKLPGSIDETKITDDLYVDQFFLGELVKSYYLSALLMCKLQRLKSSSVKFIDSMKSVVSSENTSNNRFLSQRRLTPELIEKWLVECNELIKLSVENDDIIDSSIEKVTENILFMSQSDRYKHHILSILASRKIKNQMLSTKQSSMLITKLLEDQKTFLMSIKI